MIYLKPIFPYKEEITLEYMNFVNKKVNKILGDDELLVDSKKLEWIINNKFSDVTVTFDDNDKDIEKYYGILTYKYFSNYDGYSNYIKRQKHKETYEYNIHIFKPPEANDENDEENNEEENNDKENNERYLVSQMANALAVLYILMLIPSSEREKLFINDGVLFYNTLDAFSDLITFFRINLLMPSSVFQSDLAGVTNYDGMYNYGKLRRKYVDENCRDSLDFETRLKFLKI